MSFATEIYPNLKPLRRLQDLTVRDYYVAVPDDWHIALSDVQGSTRAIEAGKYREVNAIAAAMIAAILNKAGATMGDIDLPFVFGGDGATILIPPELVDETRQALIATRRMAQSAFNLTLRVGIVPVKDVSALGDEVNVARLWISDNFQQAIFTGQGLSRAEQLLKQPGDNPYNIADEGEAEADFSGFECRWQEIPSPQDEVMSLLVQTMNDADESIYPTLLNAIDDITGGRDARHPLTPSQLRLKLMPWGFALETKLRYGRAEWRRLLRTAYYTLLARIAMKFNIGRWGEYKQFLVDSTDHEKFDDALRMTIACTRAQRQAITAYLDDIEQQGRIVYGIHTSRHALVTCVVYDYFGRQVHFVDGAGGGYTLAAKAMKAKIKARTP